jgi:esterase/lipase superfamily enzyme
VKETTRWYSPRVEREVTLVRWGAYGVPVLLFPTAGGDAEEVERFHMIDVLDSLLAQGRVKVYSCDSAAGRAWITAEGSVRHRMWVQNQFHQYVAREVVPAIRLDCRSPDTTVIAAGASIGAFNALAVLCRFPALFEKAICMSGTFNLERFLEGQFHEDFYHSSPYHFVPRLSEEQVEPLRRRFALLASGRGRAEDIGESWRMAHLLGQRGIPNRVDDWGEDWPHDWPTWRRMLPQYLGEFA